MSSEDYCTLDHHGLRAARAALRREREHIVAAAIAEGPSHDLCLRMNALEVEERRLTLAESRSREARRGHRVRHLLSAMRIAG